MYVKEIHTCQLSGISGLSPVRVVFWETALPQSFAVDLLGSQAVCGIPPIVLLLAGSLSYPTLQCELLRPQGSLVRSQEEKKKHQVTILNAVLQNFYLEIISQGCILLRTGASHHLTERLIPDVFPSSFLKKSSISRHRDLGCPKHVSRKFTALYSKSGLSESWSLLL